MPAPRLFICSVLLILGFEVSAQVRDTTLLLPEFKEYRFNLPEKVKEIRWIEYEKTRMPMHGKLAPDSTSVILRHYQRGEQVRVKVILLDGSLQEYVKSPCFIDPVIEIL